jgi:hypothetical protein
MGATLMKRIGVISTAVLFVLLGTAALAYPQQEQQDEKQNKSEKEAKPTKARGQKASQP